MPKRIVQQAGAVVFRVSRGRLQILLVRARRTPDQWIFPKGHIEDGETAKQAAIRETQEEAGVDGDALARLRPRVEFDIGTIVVRVQYYLVRATRTVGESEGRDKKWVAPSTALRLATHDSARAVLRSALAEISRRQLRRAAP
jgi:8-oxo-dGTP pyrophosphatase MutT (NUDIX family)